VVLLAITLMCRRIRIQPEEIVMSSDHRRFPAQIQKQALVRQKLWCASCDSRITAVGEAGQAEHEFGERAEGHHVIPHKMHGPISVENCVIVCRSCHLNAHQGGRWRDVSIYRDVAKLPMCEKIAKVAVLYPHFNG
jgi:hypothetical protein